MQVMKDVGGIEFPDTLATIAGVNGGEKTTNTPRTSESEKRNNEPPTPESGKQNRNR